MKKIITLNLLMLCFCLHFFHLPAAAQTLSPDQRAVDLLNKMMGALLIENEEESAKAVKLLVHKSLLAPDGRSLSRDVREFSFRKAHSGAKLYSAPVVVTRVRQRSLTAIGFQETAEEGTEFDYFIAKKEGVAGLPAPVRVFFPKNGNEPRISYMGSL
jgi:hypothetical protein